METELLPAAGPDHSGVGVKVLSVRARLGTRVPQGMKVHRGTLSHSTLDVDDGILAMYFHVLEKSVPIHKTGIVASYLTPLVLCVEQW